MDIFDIVKDKFKDISDKGTGAPYYWHLIRCAIRLGSNATKKEILVALLHDILEDTDTVEEDLRKLNIPEDVIKSIKLCSNIYYKDITHKEWMRVINVSNDVMGIKAKAVDLSDNFSVERLKGLEIYLSENEKPKISKKLKKEDQIFKRVKRFINKRSYGLSVRFFEDLEIISKNNENILKDLNLSSFGSYEEYLLLKKYLKDDFLDYGKKMNVNAFKKECIIKIELDKSNQPYLVADIDNEIIDLYNEVFKQIVNNSYNCIENKKKRDNGKSHITILTAMEYKELIKNNEYKNMINDIVNQKSTFIFSEIGSIEKENNNTYYALCENGYLQQFRKNLNLEEKDFHMTIGFDNKDLFHKRKIKNTKICDFTLIWNQLNKNTLDNNINKTLMKK